MKNLDTHTLLIAIMVSGLLFGVLHFLNWRSRPAEAEFPLWGSASLCSGACCLLAVAFGAREGVWVAMANSLAVLFFALMWSGLRLFAERALPWRWLLGLPLGAASLLLGLGAAGVGTGVLVGVCSIAAIGLCIACLRDFWRAQVREPLTPRLLAVCAFLILAAVASLQVWSLSSAELPVGKLPWLHPAEALGLLVSFLFWNQAILLMVSERQATRLQRMAHRDDLTGVLNRAGFNTLASRQIARSLGQNQSVFVLLLDLDRFKAVNDHYGHEAGDRLLAAFARLARDSVRVSDLVARYGGEEFCLLLPDATAEEAIQIAERLRRNFEQVRIPAGHAQVGTTVSIGAAEIQHPQESLSEAVRRADLAMYQAKHAGRNRVVLAPSRHAPLKLARAA